MKKAIHMDGVIGTYSPAIEVGGVLYVSGQLPRGAEDFEGQAQEVFDSLEAVLAEAGYALSDVVRLGVFVTDLGNFDLLNSVFAERLEQPYPARSTVQVVALPKGVLVEIDAIAVKS